MSEKSTASQQAEPDPRRAGQECAQKTWIRPDFDAVDTALEVTAYSGRD